jgi:hypothetical protein
MKKAVLAGALCFLAALARAGAPAWVADACAGLDCAAAYASVGQSDFLPEMRLSSAVAYAQAVRGMSAMISNRISVDDRMYEEGRGKAEDSAVRAVVSSPLGSAMTKVYGDDASDFISMAIELKPLEEPAPQVYAEEYVDVSSQTLYVRLVMSRTSSPIPASGGVLWKGGRIRVSSEDVRVRRKNELTLWVEDKDAGLTWIEYWPTGGANLMRDGQASSSFVFDRVRGAWKSTAAAPPRLDQVNYR